jgi:hypothetical protein
VPPSTLAAFANSNALKFDRVFIIRVIALKVCLKNNYKSKVGSKPLGDRKTAMMSIGRK